MIKVISLHFKIIVKNVVNNWKCFQYNESKNKYGLDVVAHTCSPALWEAGAEDSCEFKASLD